MPSLRRIREVILPLDSYSDSSGFLQEVDRVRRSRLALTSTVGALMCVLLLGLRAFLQVKDVDAYPRMIPGIIEDAAMIFHTLSFIVAALLFRLKSLQTQTILALDFLLFAANFLARAIATVPYVNTGDHFPGIEGIMFGIALHGVFVPTRVGFAVLLGAVATLSFPLAQYAGIALLPTVREHWMSIANGTSFPVLVALNTFGIFIFAFLGALASRIFYGLARSAHGSQQLGNYTIEGEIGTGGMGTVYLARHAMLRRATALKVLKFSDIGDTDALARFEREVDLASKLTHPNTIAIYDYGRAADGRFYYVMERLEGLTLYEFVQQFGPVPASRAIHWLKQICGSLSEAHGLGIIHRDIKPHNIFLTDRGGVFDFIKVIDFGLAKQLKDTDKKQSADLTEAGRVFGTPHYLAPEGVFGADQLDHRADIYSVGAVAFWILTGRHLFDGDAAAVLMHHQKTSVIPPSKVSEIEVPPELDIWVCRSLEKKREDRFATVDLLLRDLEDLGRRFPWTSKDARTWWETHEPKLARRTGAMR